MTLMENIEAFVQRIRTSPEFQNALVYAGNETSAVARFANAHGYHFTEADLDMYLDAAIAQHHSEEELSSYAAYKQRLRAGELPGPSESDHECDIQSREIHWTPGSALDRGAILRGELHTVSGVPTFQRLLERLRANLARAFEPDDVLTAHERLDERTYAERVRAGHALQREDAEIGAIMAAFLAELGFSLDQVRYEWPGVRIMLPQPREGVPGYYRDVETIVLNPHRDTWYGGPFHQINVWAPVHEYVPGSGVKLFPRYFEKSLANNTRGTNIWRARLGLNLRPVCLQEIDEGGHLFPALPVGSFLCFAANHLHGSGTNRGKHARISVEFRLLHDGDPARGNLSKNVDYFGYGSIDYGWHRPGDSRGS